MWGGNTFSSYSTSGENHKRVYHFQPTQLLSESSSVTSSFKSYDTREVLLQPWTTLIETTGRGDAPSLYTSLVRSEMEKTYLGLSTTSRKMCVSQKERVYRKIMRIPRQQHP